MFVSLLPPVGHGAAVFCLFFSYTIKSELQDYTYSKGDISFYRGKLPLYLVNQDLCIQSNTRCFVVIL